MIQSAVRVKKIKEVAQETYLLEFYSPQVASSTAPGQFVNIKVDSSYNPLLRRPFSVCHIEQQTVKILFNVIGRGTKILAGKKIGDEIDVLGPLGRGFEINDDFDTALIVAGGLGVAPFPLLTAQLKQKRKNILSFIGAKTQNQFFLNYLANVSVSTDDGSKGYHGTVVQLIEHYLTDHQISKAKIFGCGPNQMLKALSAVATEFRIPCEVSLECEMACGVGLCQGCPVETADGTKKYRLVCKDGPIFSTSSIVI